jgi:hypothetical protein
MDHWNFLGYCRGIFDSPAFSANFNSRAKEDHMHQYIEYRLQFECLRIVHKIMFGEKLILLSLIGLKLYLVRESARLFDFTFESEKCSNEVLYEWLMYVGVFKNPKGGGCAAWKQPRLQATTQISYGFLKFLSGFFQEVSINNFLI